MSETDKPITSSQSDEIARQIAEIMSKSFAMMIPSTVKPEDTNNPPEPPTTYKIDTQPLHIGGNKLNGENYSTWAVLIHTAISGRGMVSHITGVPPPPPRTDPGFPQWQQADHCVFTWLIQNIEPRLVNRVSKQPTAKHIWDALAVTYGSGGDKLQVYDLYTRASMVKQGNQSLEETWSTLQDLWLSIDQKQTIQMKYPEDIELHEQFIQELRLYQFLTAIDSKYETTKREIVKMEPLPSVDQAYNLVQREETRSQVLQPGNTNNGVAADGVGAGLAVRGRQSQANNWAPSGSRGGGRGGGGGTGGTTTRISQNWCAHIARRRNTPKNCVSS